MDAELSLGRAERELGPTFALEDVGFIDFETRSPASIKAGTYRYASEADAIILSYALGADPARTVAIKDFERGLGWFDLPLDIYAHHERVMAGQAVWAAWNAGFDRAVWNYSMLKSPLLEPHHIIDVMAQATASGLAPDLKAAAQQSGSVHKVAEGSKLIKLFCLPGANATPASHPKEWGDFVRYAAGDVEAMRSVFLGTRQLPLAEWREYWAMEAINQRGVGIDLDMVEHAAKLAAEDRVRSRNELHALTSGSVFSVDHVSRMTAWLLERLPAEGRAILIKREEEVNENGELVRPAKFQLTRNRVERLIAFCSQIVQLDDIKSVLNVLQIRLYGGSKTPAKFQKMLDSHVDGVLFGQYVFNGAAQTGRASSKGVQIHNLARDVLPDESTAIDAVVAGEPYEVLEAIGEDTPVARKLSLLIRPSFIPAAEDRVFVWSDWSQIEARILPWLAGDEKRLQIFRDVDADPKVPDLYTRTAADISHVPLAAVDKPIRQRGKVAELALGFGGGVGALQNMGAAYGLHLGDADARVIVERWRAANQWCVEFWQALKTAVDRALELPGTIQTAGRIRYTYKPDYLGGTLFAILPSLRLLTYRAIRYERVADLDEDDKVVGYSTHLRFARGHGRVKLWHGMLCENAVQAVAADVLRGTLRRLEESGHCVRGSTHDEIIVECSDQDIRKTALALRDIMRRGFNWSEGLPLMSDETAAYYYSKSEDAFIQWE